MSTAKVVISGRTITFEIEEKFAELEFINGKVYISKHSNIDRKIHVPKYQERVLEYVEWTELEGFVRDHLYNIIIRSTGKLNFEFLDTYLNQPC